MVWRLDLARCMRSRPATARQRSRLIFWAGGGRRQGCSHRSTAALLHVLSGFVAFLVLRFLVGQAHSITAEARRRSPVLGYGLIIVAGALMLFQSVRPASAVT